MNHPMEIVDDQAFFHDELKTWETWEAWEAWDVRRQNARSAGGLK